MGSDVYKCGINGLELIKADKYSEPMPIIGLYVAAATLVCLLLMISDILIGFHRKRWWLPCRFFSLNSITLTLLSIATKITVDLTTPLPCPLDQLSKLTGTTFICISMGFLMPSLGASRDSECLTNLGALSIFIVTVVANICIQMHTNVIFLFRVEHVIILCCMLLLLVLLWFSAFDISSIKEDSIDRNKSFLTKGPQSMLQRLKLCYLYGYNSNPQFTLCRHPNSYLVGTICLFCLVVVGQAAIRSDPVRNASDYKWSMKMIVMIQVTTVLVGCFGANLRWLSLGFHINLNLAGRFMNDEERNALLNPFFSRSNSEFSWYLTFKVVVFFLVMPIQLLTFLPLLLVCKFRKYMTRTDSVWCGMFKTGDRDDGIIEEFKDLIHKGEMGLEEWILRKGLADMKILIEKNKTDTSTYNLIQLLSKTRPSQNSPRNRLKDLLDSNEGYEVSSLSLILVARIANASIPSTLSGSLMKTLNEVFEIIYFIDSRINFTSFKNKKKCMVAKATAGVSESFRGLFARPKNSRNIIRAHKSQSNLNQAIGFIREIKSGLRSDFVSNELRVIIDFIDGRVYESIEELYHFMEQLFVDMLNAFLTRLPNAIFKEIIESLPEEFEKRVKIAIKVLCKAESLDVHVPWLFPDGSNITSLIKNDASNVNNESNTHFGCNFNAAIASISKIFATTPQQSQGRVTQSIIHK